MKKLIKERKDGNKVNKSSTSSKNKLTKEAMNYISGLEMELDQTKSQLQDYKQQNDVISKELKTFQSQLQNDTLQERLQEVISKVFVPHP